METVLKRIANYSGLTPEECELKQRLKNSVLSNTLNVRHWEAQNMRLIYREKYPEYTFLSDDEWKYKDDLHIDLLSNFDGYIPEKHIRVILDAYIDSKDYRVYIPKSFLPHPHNNSDELYFIYDREESDITIFHYVECGILVITFWNLKK